MTKEEARAVAFVGILLCLATAARIMNRPKPVTITASAVDIEALRATGQALAKPPSSDPAWRRAGHPPVSRGTPAPSKPGGPVNINTATAKELEALPGVGPAMATRIIARRDSVGRFERVEDLDAVKGIGPSLLAKLQPLVTVR